MPYKNDSELPEYVKKYSPKIQSQWRHVFNTVYKKVLKETKSKKQAEKRSAMAANSVLKKRFNKGQNVANESHADYMSYLIDSYFGKLTG